MIKVEEKSKKNATLRKIIRYSEPSINFQPEDSGQFYSQHRWTDFLNTDGKIMISAPDIYEAFKSDSEDIKFRVKEMLYDGKFITSTRISFNSDNPSARITHYFGNVKLSNFYGINKNSFL